MRITLHFVVVVLLVDALLWGIWFGGLWGYRSAFASRLTDSYIHISLSFTLPLIASSTTYAVAMRKPMFFRVHRVKIFKFSILVFRILYLTSSIIVYLEFFNGLELLYLFSLITSIASGVGTMASITWTDYVADNIYDHWKPRYIALDSTLSNVGSLIGTAIAGLLFAKNIDIHTYGKLFLIISTIFLIDIPLIMFMKEFPEVQKEIRRCSQYKAKTISTSFYASITLLYVVLNLPISIATPYIIYKLGGDEIWVAAINSTGFVASLVMPVVWGELLKKIRSLTLAKIATVLTIISSALLPYLKTLELQVVRSFVGGAGGIGMWISLFSHMVRDVNADHRIQHSSTIYLIHSITPVIAANIGGFIADTLKLPELVFLLPIAGLALLPMIRMKIEDSATPC